MLTPQQLTEAVETLYPALDELNQWITMDMVRRFMARLGRGEDAVLSGTDRWQTEVYQAAGGHLEDLKKQLQTFTKQTDAEIASIFEDAAVKAWAADCAVYAAAGREVKPLALSDRTVKILEDAYTRTQGEAHNFTRSTASASQKRLFKVLDESYFKVITGAQSYSAAVQEGVDELVKHQTRVIYPTGHTDTLETAVLRAVRTGVSQATGNMSLQSMIDHDWDLIRVSEHLGARYGDGGQNPGNHYWWQGKLYSRTGRTPGYPLFIPSTGFGTGEGLGGYNCRHSFGPGDPNHNPYEHFDEEENRRVYDLTQKQRAKEARIRREKLEVAGYREAARNAPDGELRAALEEKALRAENRVKKHTRQYEQFCRDNDLKPLNDRLYVARRSQAAAPKAAREMPMVEKPSTIEEKTAKLKTTEPEQSIEAIKSSMEEQVLALPESAQEVLRQYTGFTATRVNFAIRNGKVTPRIQETITALDTALASGTMPQSVTLYRNTALSFLDFGLPESPTAQELQGLVGFTREIPIFTSTSFRDLNLPGRNTLLQLHVPKGYSGCQFLQPVAFPKFKDQDEVLFARGMQFCVLSANIKDGRYFLEIEVLPNV